MTEHPDKIFMTDEEFGTALKLAFEEEHIKAWDFVRDIMKEIRCLSKDGGRVVQYTQAQQTAITAMFAHQRALMMAYLQVRTQNRMKMVERIQQLEANNAKLLRAIELTSHKVKNLECLPVLRFVGEWVPNSNYHRGHIASHKGRMWHCSGETNTEPFKGSKHWSLAALQRVPWKMQGK